MKDVSPVESGLIFSVFALLKGSCDFRTGKCAFRLPDLDSKCRGEEFGQHFLDSSGDVMVSWNLRRNKEANVFIGVTALERCKNSKEKNKVSILTCTYLADTWTTQGTSA